MLLAILVCCCGGPCLALGLWPLYDKHEAASALTQYLEHVRDGDYHYAYAHLCIDALEGGYAENEHAAYLRGQRLFSRFALDNPSWETGRDGTYVTFSVHFVYADGGEGVDHFAVGMETDGPKVCDGPVWRNALR